MGSGRAEEARIGEGEAKPVAGDCARAREAEGEEQDAGAGGV